MLTNKDFGIKIAELRKKKGLTQTQLAEMLNISNKTVSRWETGEGYPEITLLSPLAKALGVTTDELLAEHEEGTSQGGDENFDIPCSDNCGKGKERGPKPKKHKEIPVEWPSAKGSRLAALWKSLIVFNKIGIVCAFICVISLLIGFIAQLLAHSSIIEISDTICVHIPSTVLTFISLTPKIGIIFVIIGLIMGAFDLYDRQYKASIIIVAVNLLLPYVMGILSGLIFMLPA